MGHNTHNTTADVGDLIAEAAARPDGGRPGRIVDIPMRAYLAVDIEDLRRRLAELERGDEDSMEGPGGVNELRRRIADLVDQLRASFRPFRLRAMPRPAYRALVDAHPPRKVTGEDGIERPHPRDRGSEFNVDSFYEPLVRASVVDPVLTGPQWQALFDSVLTDHYFTKLGLAALFANRDEVEVPFSPRGLPTAPTSADESTPPDD